MASVRPARAPVVSSNGHRRAVRGKMEPPSFPGTVVRREHLDQRIGRAERICLVAAPSGYGKTVAVRHWFDTTIVPTGWLSIDALDAEPLAFWQHVLFLTRELLPDIDDEPEALLVERGAGDLLFLEALVAQIELVGRPVCIVLDGLDDAHASVLPGVAVLVERIGHVVRMVITSRSALPLPRAHWKSHGWLTEVDADDLAFRDHDALAVAERMPGLPLATDEVLDLNRTVEGWPIAFHLGLLVRQDETHGSMPERGAVRKDRSLTDHLMQEVLGWLRDDERDVALSLSVLEVFDAELVTALLGERALATTRELHQRGLFLSIVNRTEGGMRFHPMIRELLEHELRWRHPSKRIDLHRRAASLWSDRGELNMAYRHLLAIGDIGGTHRLVVQPALDLVDRSDVAALYDYARTLPARGEVDNAELAVDLAMVCFFARDHSEAGRWCDHAEGLLGEDDTILRMHLHETRAVLALMGGDLEAAHREVEGREALAGTARAQTPMSERFSTTAARIALGSGRVEEATRWLDQAARLTGPDIVVEVTVPALRAWLEWQRGLLGHASERVEPAIGWIARHQIGPHHGALEAFVTAGWCRLAVGDLDTAIEHANRAWVDAQVLGSPWNHLQAGLLLAQCELFVSGPGAALARIYEIRAVAGSDEPSRRPEHMPGIEAVALARLGRMGEARELVDSLADGPRARLLRVQVGDLARDEAAGLLSDRARWITQDRLQAELLLAAHPEADGLEALSGVVEEGARTQWVLPFLGHSTDVERRLTSLPLERLHPHLARALRLPAEAASPLAAGLVEPLTAREQTLLELLPTHLSYAEIGERHFLSVNTVKTNLKSVYRKLGASSRSEAVERGRVLGLLDH